MRNGEIDRLQVSQLTERYDLARSAVYTRMDALGIKPEKIGNKSYVNSQQLALLDDLHEYIQRGMTTAEFIEMRGLKKVEEDTSGQSSGLSIVQPDLIRLITAIASEVVSKIQPPAENQAPLAYLEELEKAYRNGWQLRTSEIADLLDLLPSEISQYGDSFSEAGFIFTRAGYRSGGEIAWRVSKPVK